MSGVSKLITLLLVVAFALLAIVKLTNKIPDQTTVISADFVTYLPATLFSFCHGHVLSIFSCFTVLY